MRQRSYLSRAIVTGRYAGLPTLLYARNIAAGGLLLATGVRTAVGPRKRRVESVSELRVTSGPIRALNFSPNVRAPHRNILTVRLGACARRDVCSANARSLYRA